MIAVRLLVYALVAFGTPEYAHAQNQAQVRFINAAPAELQSIVISVDDARLSELAFGRSTIRNALPDGTRRITISTTTEQGSVTLIEKPVVVTANRHYTVFIWGSLVPSHYDLAIVEDAADGTKERLRARYVLMSKGLISEGVASDPTLKVYCDGVPALSIKGTQFAPTSYAEVQHRADWSGGLCRVTLEIALDGVSVPVWQDITNYFFSPHTNYSFVSIGTDPARLVVLREVDNR